MNNSPVPSNPVATPTDRYFTSSEAQKSSLSRAKPANSAVSDGEMKRCTWCRQTKPLSDYYQRKDRPGARSRCRACDAKIAKGRAEHFDPDNPPLPCGPFVRWLQELIEEQEGVKEVAMWTGLSQRRIYTLIQGQQKNVTMDLVDRALVAEGSTHLSELYPELYEMEEAT